MKKGWLIIICLLVMAAISVFLWHLKPQDKLSNIVQADAIIALVFVTIFYAIQTQRLVMKQDESLKEERERRSAEFGDRKLQEFFSPMIVKLAELTVRLKDMKSAAELDRFASDSEIIMIEISKLMEKYMYLLPYETIISFGSVMKIHKKAFLLNKEDAEGFENWKKEYISAMDEFDPEVTKLTKTLLIRVSETFGIHNKETIEKLKKQISKYAEKI